VHNQPTVVLVDEQNRIKEAGAAENRRPAAPHDGLTPKAPDASFVLVLDHLLGSMPPLSPDGCRGAGDGPLDGPGVAGPVGAHGATAPRQV